MRRLWLTMLVSARRAWCHWFGCIPPKASRLFLQGQSTRVQIAVTVHCHRCWRRYTELEQRRAVRFFERAGWPSG